MPLVPVFGAAEKDALVSLVEKLPEPLRLRDGRELITLSDGRALILGVAESQQQRPTWTYATELLLQAGGSGKPADLKDAWAQIARAAHADGMKARN